MITLDLLPSVKDAVNQLAYGHFSLLTLNLAQYANMTGPQARGFGKQFFDSVQKGFLDTPMFRITQVPGTKNPQVYEKSRNVLPHLAPTYPLETLLRNATVEQAIERIFEVNFDRLARYYTIPFVPITQEAL
jgi:hypothetical protein